MLPLKSIRLKMLLFDNGVLKMYLFNRQLNFHKHSFNYFILFLLHKTICWKYMICGSQDDTGADTDNVIYLFLYITDLREKETQGQHFR